MHAQSLWTSQPDTLLTAWQQEIRQLTRNPWLLSHLLQRGAALGPRFAGIYQQLQTLPRRTRRALQGKLARSLAGVALLLTLGQGHAEAASILVNGTTCSLINALTTANSNTNTGGCVLVGTAGNDTVVLEPGSIHTLTTVNNDTGGYGPTGLPVITSHITIEGNGSTITRASDAPDFRILRGSNTGTLILRDTTVSGGRGTLGGGIRNDNTLVLINSTVANNSASGSGGGIFAHGNNRRLIIENSTIVGNTAGSGGGIVMGGFSGSSNTIINSTISGNTAEMGGGVWTTSSFTYSSFIDSTITNNTAILNAEGNRGYGAGVLRLFSSIYLTFQHTIVSGNIAASGRDTDREMQLSSPLNITADEFNIFGIDGDAGVNFPVQTTDTDADGKVDIIPPAGVLIDDLLASLADNGGPTLTHALVAGSLAVDGVLAGSCPATDQRGGLRPIDGDGDTVALCDIGAFELAPPVPPELAHDLAVTNITVPKTITLTDAKPTQTKTVKVQIQNRSAHTETILDMDMLAELVSLDLLSLGACPEPTKALVPPNKFPLLLKSKQKLNVAFEVTFDSACVNDPAKSTAKDPGHEDYAYTATVDHSALDGGIADDHLADDSCPRDPLGTVPNPDGKIKDKGCAEEVTDVVVK